MFLANGTSISCCDANNNRMGPYLAHPACMAIPIAPDDEFYNNFTTVTTCMNFVRTVTGARNNCSLGAADQVIDKQLTILPTSFRISAPSTPTDESKHPLAGRFDDLRQQ